MATASAAMGLPNMPPITPILLISEDPLLQVSFRRILEQDGYWVEVVVNRAAAIESLNAGGSSLILLDATLTDVSGLDLLPELRQLCPHVPALVLGTKPSVGDRVLMLELGADDYVSKPFNERELLARVREALRRSSRLDSGNIFSFGDVIVDISRMQVKRTGTAIPMTAMEFNVLTFFLRNPKRVISRQDLLNEVWGYQNYPTTRTVDTHILRLRKKLEGDPARPQHLRTVHGIGYEFVP